MTIGPHYPAQQTTPVTAAPVDFTGTLYDSLTYYVVTCMKGPVSPETVTDVSEGFSSVGSDTTTMHDMQLRVGVGVNNENILEQKEHEDEEDKLFSGCENSEMMAVKTSFSFIQQDTKEADTKFPGLLSLSKK